LAEHSAQKKSHASEDLPNVPTQLPVKVYGQKAQFISLKANILK